MPNYSAPLSHGRLATQTVANPGAGTDAQIVLSSQFIHNLVAVTFDFTASATVANRYIRISLSDTVRTIWISTHESPIVASGVAQVTAWQGAAFTPVQATTQRLLPIPQNIIAQPLWTVNTLISNIQAGDQVSNFRIWVRQWIP